MMNKDELKAVAKFVGETALLRTAHAEDVRAIQMLVQGGADINEAVLVKQPHRFDLKLTPLMVAGGSRDGVIAQTL
jgi:hypothetical protein